MKNKCPKCGFEYGEFDVFCSRCGTKISIDFNNTNQVNLLKKSSNLLNVFNFKKTSKAKNEIMSEYKGPKLSSNITNIIIMFAFVTVLVALLTYLFISKSNLQTIETNFKNAISNPTKIPYLKQSSSYQEFSRNLDENIKFLKTYMRFSNDSIGKKEQIFIKFLDEVEKLPNLTSDIMSDTFLEHCKNLKETNNIKACETDVSKVFKNVGVNAFSDKKTIYLYPDYKFIYKEFNQYLSDDLSKYLKLKAKYNEPVTLGLNMYMNPKTLADKIADFEMLYLIANDSYIKDSLQEDIYYDFRSFIFNPYIYATTTLEMKKEFQQAYSYFIKTKTDSSLRPVIMSYLDKKRSYTEENFKNDYPYKFYYNSLDETIDKSIFIDIFGLLRKSTSATITKANYIYKYTPEKIRWSKYIKDSELLQNEFVITEPDSNRIMSVYNCNFSLVQEISIQKYTTPFVHNGILYIYNANNLSISKIHFNGKKFIVNKLLPSDVKSVFPGVQVISIDSYSNYNINIEKNNKYASFIILSRYSDGFENYSLDGYQNQFTKLMLPNMFSVNTNEKVTVYFHSRDVGFDEISQNTPTYTFAISTIGYDSPKEDDYAKYDKQTATQQDESSHEANIMPKIEQNTQTDDQLLEVPKNNIEPPEDLENEDEENN